MPRRRDRAGLWASPNREIGHAHHALYRIRGEVADLRALVDLLEEGSSEADAQREAVELLNQLGASATPVADEVRQLLDSGALPPSEEGLRDFLGKVQQGVEPRISYEW